MSESDKQSLRESFANLRKALPEGITEADADALQDIALRLMDRGLPRPAVFRYDDNDNGQEITADFCVPHGRLVLVMDGDNEGHAFAAANGFSIGKCVEFMTSDEAARAPLVDGLVETWAKVITGASQP